MPNDSPTSLKSGEQQRKTPEVAYQIASNDNPVYRELEDIIGSEASVEKDYQTTFQKLQKIPEGSRKPAWVGNGGTKEPSRRGEHASRGGTIDDSIEKLYSGSSQEILKSEDIVIEQANLLGETLSENKVKTGSRDINHVNAVILSHNASIQYCYERQRKERPGLKGKLVVRFTIAPIGKVIDAQIISSTLNDIAVEQCILSRIWRWDDFGVVDAGIGNTTVRQTYSFGY